MAASSAAMSGTTTTVRVRLHFDYPPPRSTVADCRMCWLLVDLHRCRVIADLESVIRDKFHFSRKSLLSLFVEDCYLPHTESILVVRDNDTVRVKVDTLAQVNGCSSLPGTSNESSKRARCTEDDGSPTENGESVKKKSKKKKEKVGQEAMEAERKAPDDDDGGNNDTQTKKKHKKKKKKKKIAAPEQTVANAMPKPAVSTSKPTNSTAPASMNTKGKTQASQRVSSSDSSDSSSEEDKAPKKTPSHKAAPKTTSSMPTLPAVASQPAKSTAPSSMNTKGKTQTSTQRVSSSDSSDSSSEEDKAHKKTPSQKTAPKSTSSMPTLPKPPPKAAALPVRKPHPPLPSSSSETDSSCDEAPKKAAQKNASLAKPVPSSTALNGATSDTCKPPPGSSSSQPAHSSPARRAETVSERAESADSSDSSSEEEIKLVIKRPNMGRGFGLGPTAMGSPPSARGRGRGSGRGLGGAVESGRGGGREGIRTRGGRRSTERGRGHVNFGFNYDDQQQQPSYHTDSLTNESVVLQNPDESAPKRDYSTMPLLAAPPPVGGSIAFKLLELTENYTPEVSEYKEGRIVSFDPITKQIQLELLSASRAPVEPGKFDLVYTNADGTVDRVESAVTHSSQVAERWESLLEPRLII